MVAPIVPVSYVLAHQINWATPKDLTDEVPLPEWCYKLDQGGGISIKDAFVIHSVAKLPQDWDILLHKPFVKQILNNKALAVAAAIPFYSEESNNQNELRSSVKQLRCIWEDDKKSVLMNARPQFLFNCVMIEQRCLVGEEADLVRTLLVVLQRPWCVLEICCCDTVTLHAMLDFAQVAAIFDNKNYALSVILLQHEKRARDWSSHRSYHRSGHRGWRSEKETLQQYAIIIESSTKTVSLNLLWLRILSICGLELNWSYSELLRCLHDRAEAEIPKLLSVYSRVLRQLAEHAS
jgi:hypothetical protein